jgi:hypothetical protein
MSLGPIMGRMSLVAAVIHGQGSPEPLRKERLCFVTAGFVQPYARATTLLFRGVVRTFDQNIGAEVT